ncbi:hypothetical protein CEXT_588321 [Caerostris extrusa]|uniref:Uncharacterized protein n=1 Tax=Caerostris extrusa TaxID=172846 RepID=A0AAV4NP27_CAEEX|nr:hypothetical protein CEXT_588321 [Caerostris extrusa]
MLQDGKFEMFSNAYEEEQFLSFLPRHNRKKPVRPGIVTICNQKVPGKKKMISLFVYLIFPRLLFFISSLEVGNKVFRSLPFHRATYSNGMECLIHREISSICC